MQGDGDAEKAEGGDQPPPVPPPLALLRHDKDRIIIPWDRIK
jgi:hypothetical protein